MKTNNLAMRAELESVFDRRFYLAQIISERDLPVDPMDHYLSVGAKLGLDPSPLFSSDGYLESNSDVANSGWNPLSHYVAHGIAEGRLVEPSLIVTRPYIKPYVLARLMKGFFDPVWYLSYYKRLQGTVWNPIEHYLTSGEMDYLLPNPWFDADKYILLIKDLPADVTPAIHFSICNTRRGEFISKVVREEFTKDRYLILRECFDGEFYCNLNPDVASAQIDPLNHYLEQGWKEGRDPSRYFNVRSYLRRNPDVHSAGVEPFTQYLFRDPLEDRSVQDAITERFGFLSSIESTRKRLYLQSLPKRANDQKSVQNDNVAVHIHCFYIDKVEELILLVSRVLEKPYLFLTTNSLEKVQSLSRLVKQYMNRFAEIEIQEVPNRGRDLAPFVINFLPRLRNDAIILHLHTKSSPEKGDGFGDRWSSDLITKSMGSKGLVSSVMRAFDANPSLGLLYPEPMDEVRPFMNWGLNHDLAKVMIARLKLSPRILDRPPGEFPAGSFFWARAGAFSKLVNLQLKFDDFPNEPIGDDGTLAHTLERLLPEVASDVGYEVFSVARLQKHLSWPNELPKQVSVIIPCLNAMPWLPQTLNSLMGQVHGQAPFEVVIVDNGSTDGSLEYARFMAEICPIVKVVVETRKGAGSARNRGIEESIGTYIMFLDADDVLVPDAIGTLFDAALCVDGGADLVTSSLAMFSEEFCSNAMPFAASGRLEIISPNEAQSQKNLWTAILSDFGACCKLYKRSFLERYAIRFPEDINYEDNYFVGIAYSYAEKVAIAKKVTYLYRRFLSYRGLTQSTSLRSEDVRDQAIVVSRWADFVEDNPFNQIARLFAKSLLIKMSNELRDVRIHGSQSAKDELYDEIIPMVARLHRVAQIEDVKPLQIVREALVS